VDIHDDWFVMRFASFFLDGFRRRRRLGKTCQELAVQTDNIRYRREIWISPTQGRFCGALPAGVQGEFGPRLRTLLMSLKQQLAYLTKDSDLSAVPGLDVEDWSTEVS
jgi:hypothetical protein